MEGVLPAFDFNLPAFDSILPAFDSNLPAFDSNLPAFDSVDATFDVIADVVCDEAMGMKNCKQLVRKRGYFCDGLKRKPRSKGHFVITMGTSQPVTKDGRGRMYDVRCMMYDVQCTMYNVRCTKYDVRSMMYEVRCMMEDGKECRRMKRIERIIYRHSRNSQLKKELLRGCFSAAFLHLTSYILLLTSYILHPTSYILHLPSYFPAASSRLMSASTVESFSVGS